MTKIEWTNKTWNPITGCTKYSEGCKNCYAEKMHKRLTAMGQEKYKKPFSEVVFHRSELGRIFNKNIKMCFVNSMCDTFHQDVLNRNIQEILNVCGKLPQIYFQILTKRAERLPDFSYPINVWLGVTVEMAKYKPRMDYLKQTNAKIKFLSCEPLLEDLGDLDLRGIDWVIVGGESGKNARPMHPDWVRNIQRQCKEQNVPFFFKQWGEYRPVKNSVEYGNLKKIIWVLDNGSICIDTNLRPPLATSVRNGVAMTKVGKRKAGALLDGAEYKEFPPIK